jgi:hypothetical protein
LADFDTRTGTLDVATVNSGFVPVTRAGHSAIAVITLVRYHLFGTLDARDPGGPPTVSHL